MGKKSFDSLIEAGLLEIGDGYRAKNDELGGDGPMFLRAGHVTDSHIDFSGVERFHRHLAARVASKISCAGDTVITTKGNSTGRTSYVHDWMPSFVYSPHLCYWRSRDVNSIVPGFLRYWAQSNDFQSQLRAMSTSTDMAPYLSLTDQRRLSIDVPDISNQRAIASILGTLDDKIELNRRMNETLEELARTIFKSWFVDFDPVKAKVEGRKPEGMDAETAALFPSRFVESELGMIPEGWVVGRLDDLLVLQRGFDLPTPLRTPGPYPVVAASGPTGGHTEYKVKAPGVVTGRSGVLGRVFLVMEDFWPLNTALWVKELKRAGAHYAYFVMQRVDFSSYNAGSAVPTLNRNHVHGLPHLLPSASAAMRFEMLAQPLFTRKKYNVDESERLTSLRDSLLPKLISGELRVPDAEKLAEAVL